MNDIILPPGLDGRMQHTKEQQKDIVLTIVVQELVFVNGVARDVIYDPKTNKLYILPRYLFEDMIRQIEEDSGQKISDDKYDSASFVVDLNKIDFSDPMAPLIIIRAGMQYLLGIRSGRKILKEYEIVGEEHKEDNTDGQALQEPRPAVQAN